MATCEPIDITHFDRDDIEDICMAIGVMISRII